MWRESLVMWKSHKMMVKSCSLPCGGSKGGLQTNTKENDDYTQYWEILLSQKRESRWWGCSSWTVGLCAWGRECGLSEWAFKKSIKIMHVRNTNQGLVQMLNFENLMNSSLQSSFFIVRCHIWMKTIKNPNSWNSVWHRDKRRLLSHGGWRQERGRLCVFLCCVESRQTQTFQETVVFMTITFLVTTVRSVLRICPLLGLWPWTNMEIKLNTELLFCHVVLFHPVTPFLCWNEVLSGKGYFNWKCSLPRQIYMRISLALGILFKNYKKL